MIYKETSGLIIFVAIIFSTVGAKDDSSADEVWDSCAWRISENTSNQNRGSSESKVKDIEKKQEVLECLADKTDFFSLSQQQQNEILQQLGENSDFAEFLSDCQNPPTSCDSTYPYRSFDGTCNNLQHSNWGSGDFCQSRLLPASYEGSSGFRKSVTGSPLPEPRQLSLAISPKRFIIDPKISHMYPFYGQLIAHDIVFTTQIPSASFCCPPKKVNDPQCAPILISKKDPFYSKFNQTCFNFVRSTPCPSCQLGKRSPMSQVSAFIDCSFMYGTSGNQALALRRLDGTGKLKTQNGDCGPLLPPDKNRGSCGDPNKPEFCFVTGDPRGNQHTQIMMLQTVFLRLHNIIADKLMKLNPHWDEEKLFQESRKIVSAMMQVITYKEYLPLLIGPRLMDEFDLNVKSHQRTRYREEMNPAMLVEFTTSAYRLHSLVNYFVTPKRPKLRFKSTYFNTAPLYEGCIGQYLGGISSIHSQEFDRYLVPDLTESLFQGRDDSFGQDMFAIHIQRGRDHGVPPYTKLVEFCSRGRKVSNFRDLFSLMDEQDIDTLKENYKDVNDVDSWVGMMMERPTEGGLVGPTAACIIGIQFHHLKYGDRFYCEHGGKNATFTEDQVEALKNVKFSQILCEATDMKMIQGNAFLVPSTSNPRKSCDEIPEIDISAWKERKN